MGWEHSVRSHNCMYLLIQPMCFLLFCEESEGTLTLPQVESFHRLQDDDATTISSDDSFFSAAEVSSVLSYYKHSPTTNNTPPPPLNNTYFFNFACFVVAAVQCYVSGRCLSATEASGSLWRSTVFGQGKQGAIQIPEVNAHKWTVNLTLSLTRLQVYIITVFQLLIHLTTLS